MNAALPDDRTLAAAALSGDRAATRLLITRLTPIIQARVARVLLRVRGCARTSDRPEVLDITQEVLMSLFAHDGRLLRAWDPARGASLRGFVGLISQRQAISILRRTPRSMAMPDSFDESDSLADEPGAELQVASREELERLLGRVQASLSPLGLELFYRLLVHDEPVAEVGAALGLSANAIYIWRTRLRQHVRELQLELTERDPEPSTVEKADANSEDAETGL